MPPAPALCYSTRMLALCLVAGVVAGAPSVRVGILDAAGSDVTRHDWARMGKVDEAVRRAARDLPQLDVQEASRTTAKVDSVADMGIVCGSEDAVCLGKVAVLVDVDRIVAPSVRFERDRTWLKILVVAGNGAHSEAEAWLDGDPRAGDVKSVIEAAFAAAPSAPFPAAAADPPAETPAPPAPPAPDASAAPAAAPAAAAPEERAPVAAPPAAPSPELPPLFLAGAVTAGVGAVVTAGGVLGALVMDNEVAAKADWTDRGPKQLLGQAFIGVAAVGGAAVVAGVVLAALPE